VGAAIVICRMLVCEGARMLKNKNTINRSPFQE